MGYGPKQPKLGLNPDFGVITAANEWVRVLGGSTESFAELGLGFWQLTYSEDNPRLCRFRELPLTTRVFQTSGSSTRYFSG